MTFVLKMLFIVHLFMIVRTKIIGHYSEYKHPELSVVSSVLSVCFAHLVMLKSIAKGDNFENFKSLCKH